MPILLLAGWLTFYGAGVMEEVYDYRLSAGEVTPCAECMGMIAIPDPKYLGDRVWIFGPYGWEGPLLVVDCGVLRTPGRIAEVSKVLADRWHMRGPIWGIVSFVDPRSFSRPPEVCVDRGPC